MNKKFLLKTLPVFIALSMVLGNIGLLVLETKATSPTTIISIDSINGQSEPFFFDCQTNLLFSPVTITGSGLSSAPPGQIEQYHVQVIWGNGTIINDLGTFNPSSGQGAFTFTFQPGPHNYSAGVYQLKARLYHSQPPGNDNQADAVITIPICVLVQPECTTDSDCDDEQWCNGIEICNLETNECQPGTPPDCNDGVDCTDDSCNEDVDQCANVPNDENCSADEWVDTGNTRWVSTGPCIEKEQKEQGYRDHYCDLVEGCTFDITDCKWVDTGGTRNKKDGTLCNDGDLCTENDVCLQGVCSGTPMDCNDGIECTVDSCIGGECQYDTSACSCTEDANCDDSNPCTDNTCNLETYICESTYNNYQCDDNNLCTKNDVCSQGACSGTPIDCDDDNVCTNDSCNPETGCVYTPNTVQCDDNDPCTIDDTCLDGVCSGTPMDCDDGIECTVDTCVDGVCQYDDSACQQESECGNSIQESGEECDDGESNGQECTPPCGQTCTYCSSKCALITLQGGSCGGGVITYYSPKLTIEKSIAEPFANPGSTIDYTIVFKNTGSAVAYNIILTDTLPDGFTYTDTGLSTREWDLGTLGAGAEKTITYQVDISEDVEPGDYLNTAEVKANDLDPVLDDATIEIREGEVLGAATTTVPTTLPKTGIPSSGISFILFASLTSLIFGVTELKKTLLFER